MGGRLDGWLVLSRGSGLSEGGISGRHLACRPPWERCFQHAHAEGAGVSTVPDARGQGDAGGARRGPRVWAVISAVRPAGSARRGDGERERSGRPAVYGAAAADAAAGPGAEVLGLGPGGRGAGGKRD